jgi:catechol 2,3-dioxygenase-like lactoylglutathione lyase family enzyme
MAERAAPPAPAPLPRVRSPVVPNAISHAVVVTDDLAATLRFLTDICGMRSVNRYTPAPADLAAVLGWPADAGPTEAAIVGEGPGAIDLVEIPLGLRGSIEAGVALLAVPTADVEACAARARAAGFDPAPPHTAQGAGGVRVTTAAVAVGGVPYELVRFDRD